MSAGSVRRILLLVAVLSVGIAVGWALLAPPERQLGNGIRIVYLHVAASWTGLLGFYVAAALALVATVRPTLQVLSSLRWTGWIALAFFTMGLVLSLSAAHVNWGGVLWIEPRLIRSVAIILLGLLVNTLGFSLVQPRLTGWIWVAFVAVSIWYLRGAQPVFHPDSPIRASPSMAIRTTFYGIFVLMTVSAVCVFFSKSTTMRPSTVSR